MLWIFDATKTAPEMSTQAPFDRMTAFSVRCSSGERNYVAVLGQLRILRQNLATTDTRDLESYVKHDHFSHANPRPSALTPQSDAQNYVIPFDGRRITGVVRTGT